MALHGFSIRLLCGYHFQVISIHRWLHGSHDTLPSCSGPAKPPTWGLKLYRSFTMSTVAQNKPSKQSMTGGPKQLVGISESSLSWHGGWSKSTIAASTMTFPSFKVHDSTPRPSDPSLKTSGLSHQESTVNQPSLITTSPNYRWPVIYPLVN